MKYLDISIICCTFATSIRSSTHLIYKIMFLRFSKGEFNANKVREFKKCVFLGDSVVMEYGDKIVGVAHLHNEADKFLDYDVIVANKCSLGGDKIARFIKDMIGKSNKFSTTPTTKRRKYYVEKVDCEVLPIKAKIVFTK